MAKGQQHSLKEKRKPKQDKPKQKSASEAGADKESPFQAADRAKGKGGAKK
jgi:hypothetical protein